MANANSTSTATTALALEDEIGIQEMTRAVCMTASENIKKSKKNNEISSIDDVGTKSALRTLNDIARDIKTHVRCMKKTMKITRTLESDKLNVVQSIHTRQKLHHSANVAEKFKWLYNFTNDTDDLTEKIEDYREYVADAKSFNREAGKMIIPAYYESDISSDDSDQDDYAVDASNTITRYPKL